MVKSRNIETLYRLTPLQEGILFHMLEREDPGLYVGQYTCLIDADLDANRLKLVWSELVRRHAVLRTLFAWKGRETPLQIVREHVEVPWRFEDWRGEEATDETVRWQMLAQAEREQGFALDRAPLMRLAVVRVGERRYRFSFCYHHIILDGWSLKLLLDEAAALYVNPAGCELSDTPYSDFVDWLLSRDAKEEEAFWSRQLKGLEAPMRMPLPDSGDDVGHTAHEVVLDRTAVARIEAVAREHRTTPGSLMIAAWALLLGRYADREDVVFGTTWAGRPQQLPGCQHTAGLFINTLPTRVQIADDEIAGEYLARIQNLLTQMRAYEHTPLLQAQKASAVPTGQALFDSIVVVQSVPEARLTSRPWAPEEETFFEYSNYPMALLLRPGERFQVSLVYDRALVTAEVAERLIAHYLNLVQRIVATPDVPVGQLAMLADDEIEWLRKAGRGPRFDVDEQVSVHGLMADCAAHSPEKPALVQDDDVLSYAELSRRSRQVAHALSEVINRTVPLPATAFHGAVFLDRSPAALAAAFGALNAGGSYVPLDPAYPPERSRLVLEELQEAEQPAVIVTERRLLSLLPATALPVVLVDDIHSDEAAEPTITDADAYVMYTSGSTGRPKGTRVSHTNLVASNAARRHYYGEVPDRFLLLSSLATDSSIAGIFWTLATGGTLVLPRPREEQSVASITSIIRRQAVTHMLCLPSLYSLLLEHSEAGALDSLRTVIVAGEACPPALVEAHYERLPSATLHNEYGPSEATVWATVARLEPGAGEVTIGRPIGNVYTRIADRHGRRVPIGMPGELWIGGAGVARGYLGPQALTDSRFVGDPDDLDSRMYRSGDRVRLLRDGELRFLGRIDKQLKIRGHRVEPEEIEQQLLALDGIRDAAVALVSDANGRERLTAFSVCKGDPPTLSALRQALGANLPDFMLPQALLVTDALPRFPGGKIDTATLLAQAIDAAKPGVHNPPGTEDETVLAEIWSDVLGIEEIGIHDDFFELGGDSLLSIRILARAHKAGLDISPVEFFARPTVAEQAAIARPRGTPEQSEATPERKPEPFALANLDATGLAAVARQLGDADD